MDALFLEVAALSERLKIPRSVLETVWDMCKKTVFFSLFIIIIILIKIVMIIIYLKILHNLSVFFPDNEKITF